MLLTSHTAHRASVLLITLITISCGGGIKEVNIQPQVKEVSPPVVFSDWLYNSMTDHVYIRESASAQILVIDAQSLEVINTVSIDSAEITAWTLTPDNSALFVAYKTDAQNGLTQFATSMEMKQLATWEYEADLEQIIALKNDFFVVTERVSGQLNTLMVTLQDETIRRAEFGGGVSNAYILGGLTEELSFYTLSFDTSYDSVTRWDVLNSEPSPRSPQTLFETTDETGNALYASEALNIIFALSKEAGSSEGGKIGVFDADTLVSVGALELDWQPSQMAISSDGLRAIATHEDYVINGTRADRHDVSINDIHIFNLEQQAFPQTASYLLSSESKPLRLMMTRDNHIWVLLETDPTRIQVLIP